ncbi:MAG: 6-pyruvoyl-tetrahydropterin synthase-related protein [Pyrinomonadaceae bacterium]
MSKDLTWIGFILFIAILVTAVAPFWGIPDGKDLAQHFHFANTYFDAIRSGDLFPGWGNKENFGYGSIGIRFYPPLAYYVAAAFRILTGNWYDALSLSLFFWMFLGMLGVYFWAREFMPRPYSFSASVLYAFVPYHLSQIYQLMLFSEFAAAGITPFCFLFLTRLCVNKNLIDALLFSLSVSLLILVHIPTTLICGISLAIYTSFITDWNNPWKTLRLLALSGILTLFATAFHWLKIVTEIQWLRHNTDQFTSGYYDFSVYLFPMYLNAGEKYVQRSLWYFDIAILLTFIVIVPAVIYLIRAYRNDLSERSGLRILYGVVFTGFAAFFLMTSASKPLWEFAPLLEKIQFPWRWLSAASLMASVAFPFAIFLCSKDNFLKRRLVQYLLLSLVLLIALFDISQTMLLSEPLPRGKFETKIKEWNSEPGCQCWWPNWASFRAFDEKRPLVSGNRELKISKWENEYRRFSVGPGEELKVRVANFYYPWWKATRNGEEVNVRQGKDGEIEIPLTTEKSELELYFDEPRTIRWAHYISLSAWILILSFLIFSSIRRKFQNQQ